MKKPNYPVYVISKGRYDACLTANFLLKDQVDFRIVVEPQEFDKYAKHYDPSIIIKTPFQNLGLGSIPVRNFVWEHSIERGAKRHWIMDDNIRSIHRKYKNTRIRCNANVGLRCCEDFTDRYTNIAISGLNYVSFAIKRNQPPFQLNAHVYSTLLIDNSLDIRWRGRYNEDTDLSLRMLKQKWCTIQFNVFLQEKMNTQTIKGGNTEEFYAKEGTVPKSTMQMRLHPDVTKLVWRYGRPHHHVNYNKFKRENRLQFRDDFVAKQGPNEYGLKLKKVDV